MSRTDKKQVVVSCRHLGLANDPFQHLDNPSEEHRCYLWMQRDRVDADHQKNYCLINSYRDCPWLQISLPCQSGAKMVWEEKIVPALTDNMLKAGSTLADTSRRMQPVVKSFLLIMAAKAWVLLCAFAVWLWANAPRATVWLWNELLPSVRASIRAIGRRSGQLTAATSRRGSGLARRAAPESTMAGQHEDFSIIVQLGREASRAGRRKEAYLCFSKAAVLNPDSEDVWLWMAATSDSPEESMNCLEKALTINPSSGRAKAQLDGLVKPITPEPEERIEALTAGTTFSKLIEDGIRALDEGNEGRAYKFFVAATEANDSNETAWFWRAKTASDLPEVISCLEKVLQLNPYNEKAKASLGWAMERVEVRAKRREFTSMLSTPPVTHTLHVKTEPPAYPSILNLASLAYLFLGLLWVAMAIFPLLDESLASLYRKIGLLPIAEMPYVSSSILGLKDWAVPEFNLLYLVPPSLALGSFIAMEALWTVRRTNSLGIAFITVINIFATSSLKIDQTSSNVLVVVSILALVSALVGHAIYRHRQRASSSNRPAGAGVMGRPKTTSA